MSNNLKDELNAVELNVLENVIKYIPPADDQTPDEYKTAALAKLDTVTDIKIRVFGHQIDIKIPHSVIRALESVLKGIPAQQLYDFAVKATGG